MRILAIQNCPSEGFGSYADRLLAEGAAAETIHPHRGDPLPAADRWDAILVGGTPISVYEADQHLFLREESAFLAEAVARRVACLGICGGAQLLAQVLGARVGPNPRKEIGGTDVRLTHAGATDPLFRGFPATFPVFHWHGDTFEIPAGGALLAQGEACRNQAFRVGRVIGLQFHLETRHTEAQDWAREYAQELARFGKSPGSVVDECAASEPQRQALAARLIHNFLETLAPG